MQPSHWCHFQSVVLTGQQDGAAEEEMKTGADSQSSCMEIEGTAYSSHCYCSDLSSSVEIPFCFPCFQDQNCEAESSSGNPDFSPEQGSSYGFSVISDGVLMTASIRERSEHCVSCSLVPLAKHWSPVCSEHRMLCPPSSKTLECVCPWACEESWWGTMLGARHGGLFVPNPRKLSMLEERGLALNDCPLHFPEIDTVSVLLRGRILFQCF